MGQLLNKSKKQCVFLKQEDLIYSIIIIAIIIIKIVIYHLIFYLNYQYQINYYYYY